MTFGMPLVLLAFHSLRDRMSVVSAAALGVALAIAGLACAYYGIFAGLTLGLIALLLARRERAYWIALAGAALVTVAIVAPIFIPYQRARAAVAAPPWSIDEIRAWSATPASYLSSPSYVHEEWIGLPGAIESTFPGFVLIALAVIGVISSFRVDKPCERRLVLTYVAVTGLAFWASFGPGAFLWAAVLKVIPTAGLLRAPVRWGVVVGLGLAVLAGFGVKFVAQTPPNCGPLPAALLAFELATLPWPLVKAGPVAAAHDLLAQMPRGPVVEFLFMYRPKDFLNHTTYMYDSTSHWQPLGQRLQRRDAAEFAEFASRSMTSRRGHVRDDAPPGRPLRDLAHGRIRPGGAAQDRGAPAAVRAVPPPRHRGAGRVVVRDRRMATRPPVSEKSRIRNAPMNERASADSIGRPIFAK
jgi:hypothetical protein